MLNKIIKFCIDLNNLKSKNFEGLGLVIYNNLEDLPVISLNEVKKSLKLPLEKYDEILRLLTEVSSSGSVYQDGFHLLSKDFILTDVSQYFSTPIKRELIVPNNYGSRYRTALYGSVLKQVLYTVVISKDYGIVIFKDGEEIFIDEGK